MKLATPNQINAPKDWHKKAFSVFQDCIKYKTGFTYLSGIWPFFEKYLPHTLLLWYLILYFNTLVNITSHKVYICRSLWLWIFKKGYYIATPIITFNLWAIGDVLTLFLFTESHLNSSFFTSETNPMTVNDLPKAKNPKHRIVTQQMSISV